MNTLQELAAPSRFEAAPSGGVIYMIYGKKHNAHLIVSFHSLRNHWDGPVAILAGDEEGEKVAELLKAVDPAKNTIVQPFKRYQSSEVGRGAGYLTKTMMIDLSPFMRTVFLDADTIVVGDISPLFPFGNGCEMVFTQFADWTTLHRHIRKRLQSWGDVVPDQVAVQRAYAYPALNTGVLGFSKTSMGFARDWSDTTRRRVSFICDEIGAQLCFLNHPHKVLRDEFNASPVYSWKWLEGDVEHWEKTGQFEKARIIHGHGNKLVKRPQGRRIMTPHLQPLWELNVCNVREYAKANRQWRQHYLPLLS